MKNLSKIKIIFYFIVIILAFSNCKKDKNENPVSPTYVNFTIYLNDPEFQDLKIVGNYLFISQGGANVVVYRASQDNFVVYDRMCTNEAKPDCLVQRDTTSSITVVCDCCKSKYILTDGSVIQTPAKYPLRTYKAVYDGGDYVHISN